MMSVVDRCRCQVAAVGAFLLSAAAVSTAAAADWIPLWSQGAPGAHGTEDEDVPALLPCLVTGENRSGCGVLVCPGGGYAGLAMDHEGHQIARWLNDRGISAWILRYRLGSHGYHHPIQQGDVLRAVRCVRSQAAAAGVDAHRVGIWGFSAGGHLASTAAVHFDTGNPQAEDPVDRLSSRPDFAILCYPVITMDASFTHAGSRRHLLGPRSEDPRLVDLLSNEKHVTSRTPPVFLFHTSEDQAVPVRNAVEFYAALRRSGVPAELHIYQRGRHGVGLGGDDPVLSTWPARLEDWLRLNDFLPAR